MREEPSPWGEALGAYVSSAFQFHGPDDDLDFAVLEAFYAQMRSAFSGYYCERYDDNVEWMRQGVPLAPTRR